MGYQDSIKTRNKDRLPTAPPKASSHSNDVKREGAGIARETSHAGDVGFAWVNAFIEATGEKRIFDAMAKTLRSQNRCKDCRYTWYPRGKDLSRACPNCGSANVAIVVNWFPLIGVGAVALYLVFGGKSADRTPAQSAQQIGTSSPASTVDADPLPSGAATAKRPTSLPQNSEVMSPAPLAKGSLPAPDSVLQSEAAPSSPIGIAAPTKPAALTSAADATDDKFDRVYTDEEISALEDQMRYQGNDPIVRARLGIPSRETNQLIR